MSFDATANQSLTIEMLNKVIKDIEDQLFMGTSNNSQTPVGFTGVVNSPVDPMAWIRNPSHLPPRPVKVHIDAPVDQPIYRLIADVSIRELMASTFSEQFQGIIRQMSEQFAEKVINQLDGGLFDATIRDVIKTEARAQIKQAVAARIDDFIEEALQ